MATGMQEFGTKLKKHDESIIRIIREIYENGESEEECEIELERALIECIEVIVIEPVNLGDETARWISLGNCLHKTSVLSGLGSIITGLGWPHRQMVILPLGCISVLCAGIYALSWQTDPCCKYQVEHDIRRLQSLPLHSLSSNSPVVLVRRNDSRRKVLHNIIAFISAGLCAWRIYELYVK